MSDEIIVQGSKGIVYALGIRSADMEPDELIRYVYNEAMDDAINWVNEMGKRNPDIQLACIRLEDSMREWLPLRSAD